MGSEGCSCPRSFPRSSVSPYLKSTEGNAYSALEIRCFAAEHLEEQRTSGGARCFHEYLVHSAQTTLSTMLVSTNISLGKCFRLCNSLHCLPTLLHNELPYNEMIFQQDLASLTTSPLKKSQPAFSIEIWQGQ